MAKPSVACDEWLASYDGKHPIADLGCAYGIATRVAVERGVPVIAVDETEEHLVFVRDALGKHPAFLGARLGTLPNGLSTALPDGSVSSLLVANVLHFLPGPQCDASFAAFFRALAPGGTVYLTALNIDAVMPMMFPDEPDKRNKVHSSVAARMAAGDAWPGDALFAAAGEDEHEWMKKFFAMMFPDMPADVINSSAPVYQHYFSPESMSAGAKRAGFQVLYSVASSDPGFPVEVETGEPRPNMLVKLAARKPMESRL